MIKARSSGQPSMTPDEALEVILKTEREIHSTLVKVYERSLVGDRHHAKRKLSRRWSQLTLEQLDGAINDVKAETKRLWAISADDDISSLASSDNSQVQQIGINFEWLQTIKSLREMKFHSSSREAELVASASSTDVLKIRERIRAADIAVNHVAPQHATRSLESLFGKLRQINRRLVYDEETRDAKWVEAVGMVRQVAALRAQRRVVRETKDVVNAVITEVTTSPRARYIKPSRKILPLIPHDLSHEERDNLLDRLDDLAIELADKLTQLRIQEPHSARREQLHLDDLYHRVFQDSVQNTVSDIRSNVDNLIQLATSVRDDSLTDDLDHYRPLKRADVNRLVRIYVDALQKTQAEPPEGSALEAAYGKAIERLVETQKDHLLRAAISARVSALGLDLSDGEESLRRQGNHMLWVASGESRINQTIANRDNAGLSKSLNNNSFTVM